MVNYRRLLLIFLSFSVLLTLGYAVFAGASASAHTPVQICFGRGAVAATVFASSDRFDIYAIDPQDNGELVMSFSQEYLQTFPADGEARLLGESDRHIPIAFYRNANRLYRMVAGPDAEGKFFECTFNAVCAHERTWIGEANRPTDEVVPVCDQGLVPTAFSTVASTVTSSTSPTNPPTTVTAGPTPTDTVTSTNTATPTDTVTPTNTATPTDTVTPTNTATPTDTVTPTNTPTPTDTIMPTNTLEPLR
jgi:hypothetical protein